MAAKEVLAYGDTMSVTLMPPYVRGDIQWRGANLPMVDRAWRFGDASTTQTGRARIVPVELGQAELPQVIDVRADALSRLILLSLNAMKAPPSVDAGQPPAFVTGIGSLVDRFEVILDLEALSATCELGGMVCSAWPSASADLRALPLPR